MASTAKRDSMDATIDGLKTKLQTTQLTEATPSKRSLGLIDLPPSVRNNIYKYALDTELVNAGLPNVSYTHFIESEVVHFKSSRSPFLVQSALFLVNRQISAKALHYFYSKNLFVNFAIYSPSARHAKTMLEGSGLLFSTATPEMVGRAKQHALDFVLVEKDSSQMRANVMFPAQYLPRLINFLVQASGTTASWAPSHSIFLTLVNTYDFPVSRLQGDLLELFRMLSNFGKVSVHSKKLLPQYAEGLQSNMMLPAYNADVWLETITSLADLSEAARDKGEHNLANEYSQSIIIALTYGYLTHAETLHTQPESFSKAIQRLRWRTELGIGIGLSLLHRHITSADTSWLTNPVTPQIRTTARDMLLAEISCSKALSLATDAPSPAYNPWFLSLPPELIPPNKNTWFTDLERAQAWYALGIVHAVLGELIFAAGDMERALELWKDGEGREKVEKAFGEIRERIDEAREDMMRGGRGPGRGLRRAARVGK
ncbi:hypothetical protein DE146DRAFT_783072 [Phaeosphaeria sp. MPI-PUGE-AT-0046c]|nr:hypothetical protein DE146DRAFT_783072 [Phaeosphaeria sp. MPI-PUGE-AT-0046c]